MRLLHSLPTLVIALAASAAAQEADASGFSYDPTQVHGGVVVKAGDAVFEVVVRGPDIRLYACDVEGEPHSLRSLRGKVEVGSLRVSDARIRRRASHQATSLKLSRVVKRGARAFLAARHPMGEVDWLRLTFYLDGLEPFTVDVRGDTPEYVFVCQDPEGCDDRRGADPGTCKKCDGELVRHGVDPEGELVEEPTDDEAPTPRRRRAR